MNPKTAIIPFPIQKKEIPACKTDADIFLQSRLTAVRLINLAAAGRHKVTEGDRQYIRELNELYSKYGQPLLDFQF